MRDRVENVSYDVQSRLLMVRVRVRIRARVGATGRVKEHGVRVRVNRVGLNGFRLRAGKL